MTMAEDGLVVFSTRAPEWPSTVHAGHGVEAILCRFQSNIQTKSLENMELLTFHRRRSLEILPGQPFLGLDSRCNSPTVMETNGKQNRTTHLRCSTRIDIKPNGSAWHIPPPALVSIPSPLTVIDKLLELAITIVWAHGILPITAIVDIKIILFADLSSLCDCTFSSRHILTHPPTI